MVVEFIWCQEESLNNGAFTFIEPRLNQILPNGQQVKYLFIICFKLIRLILKTIMFLFIIFFYR